MKTYQEFMEGHKSCPPGKYYCYDMKKCRPIPTGYHIGRGGYLEQDEGKKNGSNNGNGSGNGNGGSGHSSSNGNGGGNGGGSSSNGG